MRLVVAGVVLGEGQQVLLAQRDRPATLAGLWEFPGGKVEQGETARNALRRELAEELGVDTSIGDRLLGAVQLTPHLALVAHWARLKAGTPEARDHRALRWVCASELIAMAAGQELVPADTLWVPQLLARLGSG